MNQWLDIDDIYTNGSYQWDVKVDPRSRSQNQRSWSNMQFCKKTLVIEHFCFDLEFMEKEEITGEALRYVFLLFFLLQVYSFILFKCLILQKIINGFGIGQNSIRIGLLKFGSNGNPQFNLNIDFDKQSIIKRVADLEYNGEGTRNASK